MQKGYWESKTDVQHSHLYMKISINIFCNNKSAIYGCIRSSNALYHIMGYNMHRLKCMVRGLVRWGNYNNFQKVMVWGSGDVVKCIMRICLIDRSFKSNLIRNIGRDLQMCRWR